MYSERYRKAAVAEYFDKGKNASQVAPHYNVHVSTLLRWVEKECGAPVPEKHHRGKYAGKLSVDDVQYSKRAASKYPIKTVTESVNARRAEGGKGPVCGRTVRRAVQGRKHPMKALLPMKSKPVSTANRRKRIVYCSSKAALVVQNRVYVDSKTFTRASYAGQSKVLSYQYPGKRKVATTLRAQPISHGYARVGLDFRTPLIFTALKTVAQIASSEGINTNYQLPNDPVKAGRRWGQRHPQGANLGSNGILNFLSKLKQWLPPAHPKSLASQCMSGQPISTCHALTS